MDEILFSKEQLASGLIHMTIQSQRRLNLLMKQLDAVDDMKQYRRDYNTKELESIIKHNPNNDIKKLQWQIDSATGSAIFVPVFYLTGTKNKLRFEVTWLFKI